MNEEKIKEFLERGVEAVYPNKKYLKERLKKKKLSMYLGVDPTGPTLHLGHSIPLIKLKQFQDLGHKAVLLIGDFTATIGDPTGKDKTRKPLTREQVLKNSKLYKEQASKILSFEGENPAEIKFNSEWLRGMNFEDILKYSSNLTVDQMLKRDMFKRRQEAGRPIFLHEFMYPFLQGLDTVFMEVDGEVGGNDQTFNMMMGRSLMKSIKNKEKFVVATELLTGGGGKKMGKTEGNMVAIKNTPAEMFGKIMSWPDEIIVKAFTLLTFEDGQKIKKYEQKLKAGVNPKKIKTQLAKSVVEIYHSKEKAQKASQEFNKTFSEGGLPETIKKIKTKRGTLLSDVLLENNLVSSKSQFKQLIDQGAIKNLENNKKINDYNFSLKEGVTLKIGKKDFLEIHPN